MEKKIVKQYVLTLSEEEYYLLGWALETTKAALNASEATLNASDTTTIEHMRKVLSNA